MQCRGLRACLEAAVPGCGGAVESPRTAEQGALALARVPTSRFSPRAALSRALQRWAVLMQHHGVRLCPTTRWWEPEQR